VNVVSHFKSTYLIFFLNHKLLLN